MNFLHVLPSTHWLPPCEWFGCRSAVFKPRLSSIQGLTHIVGFCTNRHLPFWLRTSQRDTQNIQNSDIYIRHTQTETKWLIGINNAALPHKISLKKENNFFPFSLLWNREGTRESRGCQAVRSQIDAVCPLQIHWQEWGLFLEHFLLAKKLHHTENGQ